MTVFYGFKNDGEQQRYNIPVDYPEEDEDLQDDKESYGEEMETGGTPLHEQIFEEDCAEEAMQFEQANPMIGK